MLNDPYHLVTIISFVLLGFSLGKVIFFVNFSTRHHRRLRRYHPSRLSRKTPLMVSIIVPCHNEEMTLENSIRGLLRQTYPNYEIIIVSDGSTDKTLSIARRLKRDHPNIRVYSKKQAGKALALNYGITRAKGAIVVSMDADSIFLRDTVEQLVLSFDDPTVVAVGGNVRVANRKRLLGKQQAAEYISGLTLQRRAFAHMGCMQVISGAIGAFRRQELLAIGGYSTDTIVEDMDVTISLARRRHKVVYNPYAIAYTEAPENLRDFVKQRYRWVFGGFQVAQKHRDTIFNYKYGTLGLIGMPYFVIFPWFDVLVSLIMWLTVVHVLLVGASAAFLLFFLTMTCIQTLIIYYAMVMDKESRQLALLACLDNLTYNHLISLVTLRAGINFLLRKGTQWNKLKRYGRNTLPEPTSIGTNA